MLRNDPPPGSRVMFKRAIGRDVQRGAIGYLKERGGHERDRPDDRFLVEYGGITYSVRRADISLDTD